MKFTTPCFVRVKDAEKRKELIEWLRNIGNPYATGRNLVLVGREDEAYSCGDNIPLFKALSAMNDENDRKQWFVCTSGLSESGYMVGSFRFSSNPKFERIDCLGTFWRKATAKEIIIHFNNQKL